MKMPGPLSLAAVSDNFTEVAIFWLVVGLFGKKFCIDLIFNLH
jgi:hypothetical protein